MSLRPSLFAIPLPMPSHLKPSQGWFWSAGGWLQPTASSMLSVSTCKPSNTFLAYKYILTQRRTGIGMNEMREMICSSWGWLWFIESPVHSLTSSPSAFIILDSSPFFFGKPATLTFITKNILVACACGMPCSKRVRYRSKSGVKDSIFFFKHAFKWTLAFLLRYSVSLSLSRCSPPPVPTKRHFVWFSRSPGPSCASTLSSCSARIASSVVCLHTVTWRQQIASLIESGRVEVGEKDDSAAGPTRLRGPPTLRCPQHQLKLLNHLSQIRDLAIDIRGASIRCRRSEPARKHTPRILTNFRIATSNSTRPSSPLSFTSRLSVFGERAFIWARVHCAIEVVFLQPPFWDSRGSEPVKPCLRICFGCSLPAFALRHFSLYFWTFFSNFSRTLSTSGPVPPSHNLAHTTLLFWRDKVS